MYLYQTGWGSKSKFTLDDKWSVWILTSYKCQIVKQTLTNHTPPYHIPVLHILTEGKYPMRQMFLIRDNNSQSPTYSVSNVVSLRHAGYIITGHVYWDKQNQWQRIGVIYQHQSVFTPPHLALIPMSLYIYINIQQLSSNTLIWKYTHLILTTAETIT
jgi:hypothetical protein